MGKKDIIDEIERRIEESDTLSAEDLDVEQQCRYCEARAIDGLKTRKLSAAPLFIVLF